ncbi:MAG: hypothetical protein Q7T78_21160, partial [Rhodoferax sp.]|nr:hypothetical protein [Rhodoferax sp.]
MKPKRLLRGSVCGLLVTSTSLAFGQSSTVDNSALTAPGENAESGVLREIVVVGVRASLASAQ